MKKIAIMAILATAVASASALDLGVRGTHSSGADVSSVGATVGQKFGKFGAELGYDRSTRGATNLNKWSLVGSYDVAKFGPMTVAAKAGVSTIDPSNGPSGGALQAGVGVSYPLMKNVALVGDYYYQKGADRIRATDGNYFSFGAKYSF